MNARTEKILEQASLKNPKDRALVEAVASESRAAVLPIAIVALLLAIAGVGLAARAYFDRKVANAELAAAHQNLVLISERLDAAIAKLNSAVSAAEVSSRLNTDAASEMVKATGTAVEALRFTIDKGAAQHPPVEPKK